MRDNNNLWVWGYVLDKIPDNVLFTDRRSFCSLETAAEYLGADNVVFMNSAADRNALNDGLFQHLSKCKRVVCGLQHGAYVETARMVSEKPCLWKNRLTFEPFPIRRPQDDQLSHPRF